MGSPQDFQPTRWSVVVRAASPDAGEARRALGELCAAYWYPLYAFVRRSGRPHHEAQDLTQGFLGEMLDRSAVGRADRDRGRFRTFLLACLKNYLVNAHAREVAQKRGGGATHLAIDMTGAETEFAVAVAVAPEAGYDRDWALGLLRESLDEVERDCAAEGKAAVFGACKAALTGAAPGLSMAERAAALGVSEGHLKVIVHRLRKRFAAAVRRRVRETVADEGDVEGEIRYLMECLAGAPQGG